MVQKVALFVLTSIVCIGFIVLIYKTYSGFHYNASYKGMVKATICEMVHEGAIKGLECQ